MGESFFAFGGGVGGYLGAQEPDCAGDGESGHPAIIFDNMYNTWYRYEMKNHTHLDDINARISRIEKSAKQWRGLAISLSVVICLGIASGFTSQKPKTITARDIRIVDDKGTIRMNLYVSAEGPRIYQFDEDGNIKLSMGVSSDGPAVFLYNSTGKAGMLFRVGSNGPAIELQDQDGQDRMKLGVLGNGAEILQKDEKGNIQMAIMAPPEGPVILQLDSNGKIRLEAGISNDQSKIVQYDENENLTNSIP